MVRQRRTETVWNRTQKRYLKIGLFKVKSFILNGCFFYDLIELATIENLQGKYGDEQIRRDS